MSEELSDKEIHEAIAKDALPCPNCNGLLDIMVKAWVSNDEREALDSVMARHGLVIVPVEKSIERAKEQRDAGDTIIIGRFPQ